MQLDRSSVTEEVKRRSVTQRAQEETSGKRQAGERRREYERRRTMVKRRSGTSGVRSRPVPGKWRDDESESTGVVGTWNVEQACNTRCVNVGV